MIRYIKQDVTGIERGIIAHGVNCQRRMNSGIAKAIRGKWPKVFEQFAAKEPILGIADPVKIDENLTIVNCYTQYYYGNNGLKYADAKAVESCLQQVGSIAHQLQLPFYMPRIGCGLGGLSWEDEVLTIVEFSKMKFFPTGQEFFVIEN